MWGEGENRCHTWLFRSYDFFEHRRGRSNEQWPDACWGKTEGCSGLVPWLSCWSGTLHLIHRHFQSSAHLLYKQCPVKGQRNTAVYSGDLAARGGVHSGQVTSLSQGHGGWKNTSAQAYAQPYAMVESISHACFVMWEEAGASRENICRQRENTTLKEPCWHSSSEPSLTFSGGRVMRVGSLTEQKAGRSPSPLSGLNPTRVLY